MSRRSRTFGFHLACLSIVLLLSPVQVMAKPPILPPAGEAGLPVLQAPGGSCPAASAIDPAAFETVKRFWPEAWGTELSVGQSGMALQETDVPEQWDVLVSDRKSGRWIDRGTFIEEERHGLDLQIDVLDRVLLEASPTSSVVRYVVAGTLIGSTGNSIAVTAMVSEINDDGGTASRSFSVVQFGIDTAKSLGYAEGFATQMREIYGGPFQTPEEPDVVTTKSGPQHCYNSCISKRNLDLSQCNLEALACGAGVAAAVAACVAACIAVTGPVSPICLGLCDLLLASGSAVCLAAYTSCSNDAWSDYQACANGCGCQGGGGVFGGAQGKLIC